MHRLTLLIIALTSLNGCANWAKFSGSPGDITIGGPAPSVPPVSRRDNADGTSVWEYNDQPWGARCFLVSINAQGRVTANVNAYSSENLARIQAGMTIAEVKQLMCKERTIADFTRMNEQVWDWNVQLPGPGYGELFNVHFRDGKVLRTSRTLYERVIPGAS